MFQKRPTIRGHTLDLVITMCDMEVTDMLVCEMVSDHALFASSFTYRNPPHVYRQSPTEHGEGCRVMRLQPMTRLCSDLDALMLMTSAKILAQETCASFLCKNLDCVSS